MIKRLMWLLNHDTASKFELPLLKQLGVKEIFVPKIYPPEWFRSASVNYSYDAELTISKQELAVLNAQNWYSKPSEEAWEIANQHFPLLFFIIDDVKIVESIATHYKGIAVWRAYGLDKSLTYSLVIGSNIKYIDALGERFAFGEAYDHLHLIEDKRIGKRSVFLPAGMEAKETQQIWTGVNKKIYFVCAEIGTIGFNQKIYERFIEDFGDLPYVVAGPQPVFIPDPAIIGYVKKEEHERNMREMRVMYYSSTEPNHIHYHPFEAIKSGMPLIFMANGILERFGGKNLPGYCHSIKEAREKIKRVLNDDWPFIQSICKSQKILLEPMKAENCFKAWKDGMTYLSHLIERNCKPIVLEKKSHVRIVIFLDECDSSFESYLLSQRLQEAAFAVGRQLEVIFAIEKGKEEISKEQKGINFRSFKWKTLDGEAAFRALSYAGCSHYMPYDCYYFPDDGINAFLDCDAWIFSTPILRYPILPIRPCILSLLNHSAASLFSSPGVFEHLVVVLAKTSKMVLTSSSYLYENLLRVIGMNEEKVMKCSLWSEFKEQSVARKKTQQRFLWFVDSSCQKNLSLILASLKYYYQMLNGTLECHIVGLFPENGIILDEKEWAWVQTQSKIIHHKHLSLVDYENLLKTIKFLWHPNFSDCPMYPILDCSKLNIEIVASKTASLECLNQNFNLDIKWAGNLEASDYAADLKRMEQVKNKDSRLQKRQFLDKEIHKLKQHYWDTIEQCLN